MNGGPERPRRWYRARRGVAGSDRPHTFYLEELNLEAEIRWPTTHAPDNSAVRGSESVSSDLYFLRIRPFDEQSARPRRRAAVAAAVVETWRSGLSQQQREIIAGTFNVVRDRRTMTRRAQRKPRRAVAGSGAVARAGEASSAA